MKILKKGTRIWNGWRKKWPDVRPDLSWSSLQMARLLEVDLHGANLYRSNLEQAELRGSNLNGACLSGAILVGSNLHLADLSWADLSGANLDGADVSSAFLGKANISKAYLHEANLAKANLQRANMEESDLRGCSLIESNLNGAKLTGCKLYGTARDNWKIKAVECRYVYWDLNGDQKSPRNRDLEPGEFERLYAALPTIEYIFENGMTPLDPLIMDRVIQAIRERQPEFDIKIDSINARGLAPSIRFTVRHEEHKEPALQQVQKEYEIKLKQLESERDRYYQLLAHALDAPRQFKLISAGPGAIVATDGSTINIQEHVHNALELQKVIADEPETSASFAKVAKKTALDIVGGAIKDVAKGQVKEAAKQIIELGKDLGPLFVRMAPAAYEFFRSIGA